MRYLSSGSKAMQFTAFVVFTFACCLGCGLGDALLDGVFLGVSETAGALLSNALAG